MCGLHVQVFAQSAQSAHGDSRMGRDTSNPTALCRERSWGPLVLTSALARAKALPCLGVLGVCPLHLCKSRCRAARLRRGLNPQL